MRTPVDRHLLEKLERLSIEAGACILRVAAGGLAVSAKQDQSPVTLADQLAEDVILGGLSEICPGIPVIAEEAMAAGNAPNVGQGQFFLVDPLDGTREFIAGKPDYTVNIALIENGVPVLGVVYCPASGRLFSASEGVAQSADVAADGAVRQRRTLNVRARPQTPTVLASRSHSSPETEQWIAALGACEMQSVGSSVKFCAIAEGQADLYPRFGRTMEWDTAAGDAVLRAAGGMTKTLDGEPLRYGKSPVYDNPFFIAAN